MRFIMSAAFAVCAFGVAPFVLVGLFLVAAGQPLLSAMRWWNRPRTRRNKKAALKAERAAEVPAPSPRRPRYSPAGSYSNGTQTPKTSEAQQIAAALRRNGKA
jgi:hypothetical protein